MSCDAFRKVEGPVQRILAVAFAVALSGCMTLTDDRSDNRSPNYQLGFGDGCTTAGTETAGAPRDPRRNREQYEFNAEYRAGWISGHAQCQAPFPVSAFIRRN
jgi:hypothetical protein